MNIFESVSDFIARGAVLQFVYLGALWGGDKVLSEDGRKHIYASLVGATSAPSYPLAVVDAFFGPRVGLGRLIWHSVAFSIAAFCVLLVCYVTTVRGLWETFYLDNIERNSYLKEIIFHGIPLVCIVNFFAFLVYGSLTRKIATQTRGAREILAADLAGC